MKQFTIELDDLACQWLEHIAELTGKPIEIIIANCIHNQIVNLEDAAFKSFSYSEDE